MSVKELKYDGYYMAGALRAAKMSHCVRLQVGAVIVNNGQIIADGWNGMPSGMDNCCETNHKTNPEVSHAEENAIMKITRSHNSSVGSAIYITHAPCIHCAKLVYNAGITDVYYNSTYRSTEGVEYLRQRGLRIYHFYTGVDGNWCYEW